MFKSIVKALVAATVAISTFAAAPAFAQSDAQRYADRYHQAWSGWFEAAKKEGHDLHRGNRAEKNAVYSAVANRFAADEVYYGTSPTRWDLKQYINEGIFGAGTGCIEILLFDGVEIDTYCAIEKLNDHGLLNNLKPTYEDYNGIVGKAWSTSYFITGVHPLTRKF